MIERLTAFCLANRAAVLAGTLVVAIWGAFAFGGLTIEAFPDPTDTQVNVITLWTGQPAEELERQVSIPIERVVNGTPGLARVRSINLFGLSLITLTFGDGVDVIFARAQTLERLRLARLPEGAVPQLGSLSTPIGEIYRYSLSGGASDRAPDPIALRTMQDFVVRPRLLQVDGVADVVSFGGLVREIHVRPDPVLMAARRVSLHDLEAALGSASQNAAGGILERGPEQLVVRSEGLFHDVADIGRVALTAWEGTPVLVSDIASVEEGWMPRQGIYSRGDDLDAVEGIVLMRRGENPTAVLQRVRARVSELNERVLPQGVRVRPFYDRTELVQSTLHTVGRNLAEGALLVLLVLVAVLLDVRAALIVCALIPMSLLSAFIYLHARGMAANLLSMGAVDFGMIVDGGVVIVENVVRRLSDPPGAAAPGATPAERIHRAVIEVARPTVFSLLIIIAAYLPIFLLQRVEGRLFSPLAHTVVAALVGGLLFSVTLVPVLATIAYRNPVRHRESPVLWLAAAIYRPMLLGALRRPRATVIVALASLALSVGVLARRGSEFMPELNEGALYLTFTLPANGSLDEGRRVVGQLDRLIRGFPQVEATSSQLGRPEDGTDASLSSNLEFFVKLRPAAAWPNGPGTPRALGDLIAAMEASLRRVPGLEVNFSQPIRDNVNENIAGQFGQIALKIYSTDLEELQAVAEQAKQALAAVPGVADLGIVKSGSVPQLQIRPLRGMLGRFGLSMAEVQGFIATALGGRAVGALWEGERSFDVVVRLPEASRASIEGIAALRIPTATGALVPVTAVADLGLGYGRASINRENGQRYVGLRMNVRGRDLGSFVKQAQAAVAARVPNRAGVTMEWGGEFESKERAMRRLTLVVPVALVVTLVLLFNAFGSVALAALVLLTVPFAAVGGALALWAFDMPMSIAAAVGFIALVGQAALNGVLVVSAIEERRRRGAPLDQAIEQGALDRLRPVLMTAALAALGLVPAALSRSMGAETQRPIAVVIVGGTVSAALLTLIVLPVMYRALRLLVPGRRTPASTLGAAGDPE